MKHLARLVFFVVVSVLLACSSKQTVQWPEPGFTQVGVVDSLQAFEWYPDVYSENLTLEEIETLEAERWIHYGILKDSFPDRPFMFMANSMYCWLVLKRDSLKKEGKGWRQWIFVARDIDTTISNMSLYYTIYPDAPDSTISRDSVISHYEARGHYYKPSLLRYCKPWKY